MQQNLAGRIAAYFLRSKLTPVLVVAICAWGLLAIFFTPRQENPQITMPAATIVTQYPGASAAEVQKLVTERGERVLQEIPGIEHIYAISNRDSVDHDGSFPCRRRSDKVVRRSVRSSIRALGPICRPVRRSRKSRR